MSTSKEYVIVRDGTSIEVLLLAPQGKPKAVVQLQSGGGLKKEFYQNFAEYLATQGFVVVLFDYRGIGGSTHDFLSTKEADILDWAKLDMTGVFRWVCEKFPAYPKILCGHSMGGIFTGFMDDLPQAKGVLLLCACSGEWRKMTFPYKILPWLIFYLYIPLVAHFSRRIPMRFTGIMEDLPRGIGKMWGELLADRQFLRRYIAAGNTQYNKYSGTLLLLAVTDDPIATESSARDLYALFSQANGQFQMISPLEVGQKKIGHSGFFSRRHKDSLWADVARWLGKVAQQG